MAGPAAHLKANGVNGSDFLGHTSPLALRENLGLTPFCARKLISLRDKCCASSCGEAQCHGEVLTNPS